LAADTGWLIVVRTVLGIGGALLMIRQKAAARADA
jgi:hypothetical protein